MEYFFSELHLRGIFMSEQGESDRVPVARRFVSYLTPLFFFLAVWFVSMVLLHFLDWALG